MGYVANIENQGIEKNTLVILSPKIKQLGWTVDGIDPAVWGSPFNLGPISRCWKKYDPKSDGLTKRLSLADLRAQPEGYFYDQNSEMLYIRVGDISALTNPDNYDPDFDDSSPGIVTEFDLFLSTKEFMGPSNPLNASSDYVEWKPVLEKAPTVAQGDRTALFGYAPLQQSSLIVLNQDGWINPLLHEASFTNCNVKTYILADDELESGAIKSNVRQVFFGFTSNLLDYKDDRISISCVDVLKILDRAFEPSAKLSLSEFPLIDPEAVQVGSEWFIRAVKGMIENHVPVNIKYSQTIATNTNRDWLTHEGTGTDGNHSLTVDSAAPNTATKTYFTTTPKFNVGDTIILVHNSVSYYQAVETVDRLNKFITHQPIAGRVITASDTGTRYYIGRVFVQDTTTGNWWYLFAGKHYTLINKSTYGNNPNWLGFRLKDNFEALVGFPETFDPKKHKIVCRVYGTASLDTYYGVPDTVGMISPDGGIASQAISLLYFLLLSAGIKKQDIDNDSFQFIEGNSYSNHSLGVAIPANVSDLTPLTVRELIGDVLESCLWRLGYIETSSGVKIGLTEVGPFLSAPDYTADEQDFLEFQYQADYSDIYGAVRARYKIQELTRDGGAGNNDAAFYVYQISHNGRDLHLSNKIYSLNLLQYVDSEADEMVKRYAFILGERRGVYQIVLGSNFINKAQIGPTYSVLRKKLPGFEFDSEIDRQRQLNIVEVQKSASAVIIVLEDQKGIQDNSGEW